MSKKSLIQVLQELNSFSQEEITKTIMDNIVPVESISLNADQEKNLFFFSNAQKLLKNADDALRAKLKELATTGNLSPVKGEYLSLVITNSTKYNITDITEIDSELLVNEYSIDTKSPKFIDWVKKTQPEFVSIETKINTKIVEEKLKSVDTLDGIRIEKTKGITVKLN